MTAPRIPEWIRYVPPEVARKMLSALAKLGIDNHPPAALVERIAMESGGDDLLIERIHSALVVADAHEDREKEGQKHMKPPTKHSTPTVRDLCDPAFTLPDPAPRYVSDAERAELYEVCNDRTKVQPLRSEMRAALDTIAALLEALEQAIDICDRQPVDYDERPKVDELRDLAAKVRGKGRHR